MLTPCLTSVRMAVTDVPTIFQVDSRLLRRQQAAYAARWCGARATEDSSRGGPAGSHELPPGALGAFGTRGMQQQHAGDEAARKIAAKARRPQRGCSRQMSGRAAGHVSDVSGHRVRRGTKGTEGTTSASTAAAREHRSSTEARAACHCRQREKTQRRRAAHGAARAAPRAPGSQTRSGARRRRRRRARGRASEAARGDGRATLGHLRARQTAREGNHHRRHS